MNDFEKKLRSRKFLLPPAAVRKAVFESRMDAEASAPTSWRDWFWPSPFAWGAVAAVLLGALAFNYQLSAPEVSPAISRANPTEPARPAVYAFFQERPDLASLKKTH